MSACSATRGAKSRAVRGEGMFLSNPRASFASDKQSKSSRLRMAEPYIRFKAPRFDVDREKTRHATFLSAKVNGFEIHENEICSGPTQGGM